MRIGEIEKLQRSKEYKAANPRERLDLLLTRAAFDELLEAGFILDVRGVIARTGYSRQHIGDLCLRGKLPHFVRGTTKGEQQYYFLPELLTGLFQFRAATNGAPK